MKPRVFIGSSTEGLDVAENLNLRLSRSCETVLWNAGAFGVSETYIGSLEKALGEVEFAVLVVTPDDLRDRRGEAGRIPRDNVVFELGLFMGRLGRDRTFIVCDPQTVELPSDLSGVVTAEFDSRRRDGDVRNAVAPAATEILHAIRQVPRIAKLQQQDALQRELADADALYAAVVAWPAGTGDEIDVQTLDTTWVWKLVPTLIQWRLNGVTVRVHAPPVHAQGAAGPSETARRTLLGELGCEVRESQGPSVTGFFLRSAWDESAAIVINDQTGSRAPLATRYSGSTDASAVEALYQRLPPVGDRPLEAPFAPELVPQDAEEVIGLLRSGVQQYRNPKVAIEAGTFATRDLLPLSTYARRYKFQQIDRLFEAYHQVEQEPFVALAVSLRSGGRSILTPPVVEVREEGPVIIDGTTRAAYCFDRDVDTFRCLAVTGVTEDLPGEPVGISALTISERTLLQQERTENFEASLFRRIERATHPY